MKQRYLRQVNYLNRPCDTHAFHANITRGTSTWTNGRERLRPFDNPWQMTEQMARNFNDLIPADGTLIHLGDWSFAGKDKIELFRSMLNVQTIILVTGNHDHHLERGDFDHLFTSRSKYLYLTIDKLSFALFHHPIESWENMERGTYHLHGHQHWYGDLRFGNGRKMDVGVDGNDLKPYWLPDVVEMLKDRKFVDPRDHHTLNKK